MMRVTDDVLEVRTWAEERGGSPCRATDGRLGVCFAEGPGAALPIGWDEFEVAFLASRDVFVYDDGPGATCCFVGTEGEARARVEACAAAPRGTAAPIP